MSYRSYVKISVPFDKFNLLVSEIDKQVDFFNSNIEEINKEKSNPYLFEYEIENIIRYSGSVYTNQKDYYIINLEYVKFYDEYPEVKILLKALEDICGDEYNMIEMGEDGAILKDNNYNDCIPCFYPITEIVTECNDEDKEIKIDMDI